MGLTDQLLACARYEIEKHRASLDTEDVDTVTIMFRVQKRRVRSIHFRTDGTTDAGEVPRGALDGTGKRPYGEASRSAGGIGA